LTVAPHKVQSRRRQAQATLVVCASGVKAARGLMDCLAAEELMAGVAVAMAHVGEGGDQASVKLATKPTLASHWAS